MASSYRSRPETTSIPEKSPHSQDDIFRIPVKDHDGILNSFTSLAYWRSTDSVSSRFPFPIFGAGGGGVYTVSQRKV